jgi:RNA polymerase sigma factor (sigma-70 family)
MGDERIAEQDVKLPDEGRHEADDACAAAFVAAVLAEEETSPEDANVDRIAIEEALETLDAEEREVISLVYDQCLTLEEAGHALGVHVSTAKRRHAGALGKMRAVLLDGTSRKGPARAA